MTPTSIPYYKLSLLALLLLVVSCGSKEQGQARGGPGGRGAPKFPVEVATVETHSVDFAVSAVGSVEAFEIVQVTARVPGVIERVQFQEGDRVTAGQPLVAIEPERYELAVQSAAAQLAKSRAELSEAEAGLTRRQELNQKNPDLVKREDIDAWQTRVSTARANVAQAEAALRTAELNLSDARAAAPMAGIIQTREVRTGEYVQPGKVIATLVRRDPMLLKFSVPELDAARLRKGQDVTFRVRGSDEKYQARVSAVAESAEETTRMIAVTAEITDPKREDLRPGSFAEVTVSLGERADLPVIPQTAIRPSDRGFLGFVIEDSTAKERVLTLGSRSPDGLVEVVGGLKAGEQIVVRGAEALRDGVPVRIMPVGTARDSITTAGRTGG